MLDLFWEEDAKIILSLPIHEGHDNVLAWHFDPKGVFSVRSASKVCRADAQNRSGGGGCMSRATNNEQVEQQWKMIWGLNCPNKLKHFLWRFSHNSQALRRNLKRRGMKVEEVCMVCQGLLEDGAHLFFKCKFV